MLTAYVLTCTILLGVRYLKDKVFSFEQYTSLADARLARLRVGNAFSKKKLNQAARKILLMTNMLFGLHTFLDFGGSVLVFCCDC